MGILLITQGKSYILNPHFLFWQHISLPFRFIYVGRSRFQLCSGSSLRGKQTECLESLAGTSIQLAFPAFPNTLAVCTGPRKGRMYSLTWEMVDWSGRKLNLPTCKNGKPLRIPYLN